MNSFGEFMCVHDLTCVIPVSLLFNDKRLVRKSNDLEISFGYLNSL